MLIMMNGKRVLYFCLVGIIILCLSTIVYSQTNPKELKYDALKNWDARQIDVLRSLYQNLDGIQDHNTFLRSHGLYPKDVQYKMVPYFTVSFLENEVDEKNGRLVFKKHSPAVKIDFYVEYTKEYTSLNGASPIWDARVYEDDNKLIVGGYSEKYNEQPVGSLDNQGKFIPQMNDGFKDEFPFLEIPAEEIIFDPFEWKLLRITANNGNKLVERTKNFLPITLYDQYEKRIDDISFNLESYPEKGLAVLYGVWQNKIIELATCQYSSAKICDKRVGYQPKLIEGCVQPHDGRVITFRYKGQFSEMVDTSEDILSIKNSETGKHSDNQILSLYDDGMIIDGYFQDWHNISGINDPQGDVVSYLFANPDTDILEAKVSNDDRFLYAYSRVVGVHGRTGPKGRYYFYTYIDIDSNPKTGYPPTRDDNCYFGVAIGDDCEAQFEFIGNTFVKTFFGFTGMGAEEEVLNGKLTLGPSYYAPKDQNGNRRERYKIEYVNREDSRFITHDYTEGSSEDIVIALSPDGSEMEMRVDFKGFLQDESGRNLMYRGRVIHIAIGVEASSDYYGSDAWGADSSPVIYNYKIK